MILRSTVAVLAGLAAVQASGVRARAAHACQLTAVADIPARVVDNEVLVQVALDGKNAEMSLDVSPSRSFLLKTAAKQLGLPTDPGDQGGGVAHIKRFTVGDMAYPDVELGMRELKPSDLWPEYQGLFAAGWSGNLGPSLLSKFDVEFDLANNHVMLFSPNACGGKIQHWPGPLMALAFEMHDHYYYTGQMVSDDHAIRLPVTINGNAGLAELSSTGPVEMQWSVANRFGISRQAPGLQALDSGPDPRAQRRPRHSYTLATLTIGQETLRNVPAVIDSQIDLTADGDRQMMLGTNFFVTNRVYIAYADRMVYFTPFSLIAKAGH